MADNAHHHREKDQTKREIAIWATGAASAVVGAWVAGNVSLREEGAAFGLFAAFVLFLLAGFLWISVAASIRTQQ